MPVKTLGPGMYVFNSISKVSLSQVMCFVIQRMHLWFQEKLELGRGKEPKQFSEWSFSCVYIFFNVPTKPKA